jgi:hypothetical protein
VVQVRVRQRYRVERTHLLFFKQRVFFFVFLEFYAAVEENAFGSGTALGFNQDAGASDFSGSA